MKPVNVTIIQIFVLPNHDEQNDKIYGLGDDQKIYTYASGDWKLV